VFVYVCVLVCCAQYNETACALIGLEWVDRLWCLLVGVKWGLNMCVCMCVCVECVECVC